MKFIILKDWIFTIPYKNLISIALISLILTIVFIWIIIYLNMSYFLIMLIPAYFANIIAFWSKNIKLLKLLEKPMDLNFKWFDGKRIFGDSKTLRGFLSGILTAIGVAFILQLAALIVNTNLYSSFDEVILFGFLAGFGAMSGDLIRSFFKRRIGLITGETWFLFDDLDFVIGALLLLGIYIGFPINFIILTLIGSLTLRLFTNIFDFIFKIKKFY